MFAVFCTSGVGGVNVSLFFIAANWFSQFHATPPSSELMRLAQVSYSIWDGRTRYNPFTAEEPPKTFPRGQLSCRLLASGCATVRYCQSYEVRNKEFVNAFPGTSDSKLSVRTKVPRATYLLSLPPRSQCPQPQARARYGCCPLTIGTQGPYQRFRRQQ